MTTSLEMSSQRNPEDQHADLLKAFQKEAMLTDWQNYDYKEKMLHVLRSETLADCSFTVGASETEIFAHKFVLASVSPVFETMFYNDHKFAEAQSAYKIPLEDVEPGDFSAFLRHAYLLDDVNVIKCSFTFQLITSYHLADRFLIGKLKALLYSEIKARTVSDAMSKIPIFAFASKINDIELMKNCVQAIPENSEIQISGLEFSAFYDFLKYSEGMILDTKRFSFLDKYAKVKGLCLEESATASNASTQGQSAALAEGDSSISQAVVEAKTKPEDFKECLSRSNILKNLLSLINFNNFTMQEFCAGPLKSAVLSDAYKVLIVEKLSHKLSHR